MNDDTKMKPPCMIVVQYILPSLRVAVARELVDELGLKKTDAADKMNVTPAAVTQYLNMSRGEKATNVIEGSEKIKDLISDLATDLVNEESPSDLQLMKMCRACQEIRAEGLICELHKEAMPSLRTLDICTCALGLE
jgi:predicted transcriptional regulator